MRAPKPFAGVCFTIAKYGCQPAAGPNSLALNSVPITVDTNDYNGNWKIGHVDEFAPGSRSMSLMPGLSYTVYIASLGSLRIQVDTQGNITSSNQTAAIGGVGSIRFATAPVYIYPQGMPGSWRISHVTDFVSGPRTLALVRGLKYEVLADFGEATQVTIDAAGKIVEGQVSLGSFALNFQPPPPPDLDADDDGVFDSIDLCANTVLKNGKRTKIDEAGCSRQQKREILRAELKKARELARAERARIREEERLVRLAAAEARKALKFQNKLP